MNNLKEQIAKTRSIALYASLDLSDYYSVFTVSYSMHDERYNPLPDGQLRELPLNGYVRVSEPVEVTFSALGDDSIVQNAVESLNAQERKAIEELNEKLAAIRERKAQLLSLTHQTEETSV